MNIFKQLMIATAAINGLFQAFATVSRSPSSEENGYAPILTWNPSESLHP